MAAKVERGKCPGCGHDVILADAGDGVREFDPMHTKMLVILGFPVIDGQKRVVLGPCQDKGDLHRKGEEPVVYFAHARHQCKGEIVLNTGSAATPSRPPVRS